MPTHTHMHTGIYTLEASAYLFGTCVWLAWLQAAYKTAKAMLCALKLKLEVQSAPTDAPTPAPTDKKGAPPPDTGMTALQPLLAELNLTAKFKLTVMLEALQVWHMCVLFFYMCSFCTCASTIKQHVRSSAQYCGQYNSVFCANECDVVGCVEFCVLLHWYVCAQVPGRRVLRTAPVQGLLKDMLEATRTEAQPVMTRLTAVLDQASANTAGGGDNGATGTPAGEGAAEGSQVRHSALV